MKALTWMLVVTHRWLGMAGCLLFMAWFASGIVMMYARMPALAREERLARLPPLDLRTAQLSPAAAANRAGLRAPRVTVAMHEGRPAYRFGRGRDETIVFADTGDVAEPIGRERAIETAQRFAGITTAPRETTLLATPDQWTLQDRARLPMYRVGFADPEHTSVYVSEESGDVALLTTRADRLWGYAGPVLHWLYFTPLRENGGRWTNVIIWSSVGGCVVAISGLLWGLLRLSPRRQFRVAGAAAASPYTGMMKWHHYAGLCFGVVSLTWVYSGLLSMEPFHWFETEGISREQRELVTGGPLRIERLGLDELMRAVSLIGERFEPRELDVVQFRGEPYWVADEAAADTGAWRAASRRPRAPLPPHARVYVSAIDPSKGAFSAFERKTLEEIAAQAMPGHALADSEWLDQYDGFYYDARGSRPLPVLRVRYQDPKATWLYFSPARGDIVGRYDRTSRLQRWLYQGLHSLDFPALYFRRPLWDGVVIALSLGGLASSVTALLPAWRRLRRHAKKIVSRPVFGRDRL